MSNYFGKDISKFLNSSQNPLFKLDSLNFSINYLKNNILQTQNTLLNLNISQDIFKTINCSNYKLYTSLVHTEIINSIPIRKGYNSISIQSIYTDFDIDIYINSIDQNVYYIYNNLYNIYLNFNQDFNLYKCLTFLYNNNSQDYINSLLQHNLEFKPFNYIHNCNSYDENYNFENIAVFPFLYEYIFILKAYEFCSNIKSKTSELIFENDLNSIYSKSSIKIYFEQYIENNKTTILNTIIQYFCKNVLSLGNSISNNFIDQIRNNLLDSMDILIDEFKNNSEIDRLLNDITVSIVQDISLQIYSHSTLKYIHETLYNQNDDYFTFTSNFSYFVQDEENIKKQILNWMVGNTEYLNALELISYKYKLNPLFFLNSFYASHITIVDTLINNISNLYNINEYVSKINITSENISNISDFIRNNKVIFNEGIINYTCIIHFKKLISNFINSDIFINWLLKVFYPKIIKSINLIYLINIYDYKHIDILKLIFNIIFVDSIINNTFMPTYVNNMVLDFETIIDESNIDTSFINDDFINSINLIFNDTKFFQDTISNFFRSSVVSKYLEGILESYSIRN